MLSNANFDTEDLRQKDRDHNIRPWTNFSTFKQEGSLVMANSGGSFVYDSDGNRYLDGIGGLWCVNVGYGQREIAEAIAEQALRLPYYSSFGHHTTPPAAELAAKVAQLAPGDLDHVFFGTGGSMANDTAVRVIHFYFNQLGKPAKKKIICRNDGYHGSTYLTMTMTGIPYDHIGFDLAPGLIHYISSPNTYRRPEDMTVEEFCDAKIAEFENAILTIGPDNVAAFFAEPVLGAGGVIVPPPGYHKRTKELCEKYDMIYVSDEVVTAFGRLGHMFASRDVFDIQPDIIVSAKGISSGYLPLSATIFSKRMYDVISVPQQKNAIFTHGFTYSGHPVCCAAGLKNIEIMERDDICGHVRANSPYFRKRLDELLDLPIVGDVRGIGYMLCVENVANKRTKALFDVDIAIGKRIANHCQMRGVIVRPIFHLNVMSPPLVMTISEIDMLVDTLRDSIKATMDDLVREGLWRE